MRRLLKYTSILLMVLMASSSVWALSFRDHVTTAPNKKGDVLIFPWYLALDGGWETKLTVINSNLSNAVVAKVIIRSFKNSEELIDFFIYLSPSDVWTGVIKKDGTVTKIASSDDSILATGGATPVFGDVTPINQPMFALDCADDADFMGYVEVIMAAYKPNQTLPTTKDKIYRGFNATELTNQGGPADNTAGFESIGPMYFPVTNPVIGGVLYTNPKSLVGYMQLQNAALGLSTSLQATTLKDYDTDTKLTTGAETRLGQMSINSLGEVEASLAKDFIALPYVNGADTMLHFLTFPTKLTQRPFPDCTFLNPLSPFFWQHSNDLTNLETAQFCVPFNVRPFDLQEHSPTSGPFSGGGSGRKFCHEVNYLGTSAFPYAEGWAHYTFAYSTGTATATDQGDFLGYFGAPVIPTYISVGSKGLSANYGAWSDGLVFGAAGGLNFNLINYQYTDAAVATL